MKYIGILLTIFGLVSAHAKEGFSTDRSALPPAVQAAWDATFLFLPKGNGQMATAFLVSKEPGSKPDTVDLYFLTADHVLAANCPNGLGVCENASLSLSRGYNLKTNREFKVDDRKRTISRVEMIRRSPNPDMALLKATVKAAAYQDIKPIEMVDNCDFTERKKVYIIGYPALTERPSIKAKDRYQVVKRWSEGLTFAHLKSDNNMDENTIYWTGTTVDSLAGFSGGPALYEDGRFWGISDSAGSIESNNFRYTGVEQSDKLDWHALITRCEYLEDFLSGRSFSFNPAGTL